MAARFVELAARDGGVVRVNPEWVIAIGAQEWTPPMDGMIRIYLHGGAQLVIYDTPGNLLKLGVEREPT